MNERLKRKQNYARNVKILLMLFGLLLMNYGLQAQVTIGSGTPPKAGALLDLNGNITDASNSQVNSNRGLLLPRVKLEKKNSLSPAVQDYVAGTADLTHTGLTVYNVNAGSPFVEGIYTWNGNEWICIRDDAKAWKIGGNTGTDAAVNYLGTSDNQPLILKANDKEGLRVTTGGNVGVNGELTVKKAEELNLGQDEVAKQLYINTNTGLVGLLPAGMKVVSPIFFAYADRQIFDSSSTSKYLTDFNNGTHIPLSPVDGDIMLNNIGVTLEQGQNAFKIKENGTYQITADLNFNFSTASTGAKIYINVSIEKSTNGGASWNTNAPLVGTRPICIIDANAGQNTHISLPLTVQPLEAGDLIRIVFFRTADSTSKLQGDNLTRIRLQYGYSPAYTLSVTRL
ncbi:MAG: hypothetical protein LBL79_00660 [Prevotella sp.]|jgi:hypothetical protein|nr:hypothetical protein [Prevotella sp.]